MSAPGVPSGARHVVIMGLMGCGKTSVAEALAARLGRPLRDNDRDLRDVVDGDAAHYAASQGLHELHRAEAGVLEAALAAPEPSIITAAASVGDRADLAAVVADHRSVWLDVDPLVLAARIADGDDHRPLHAEAVTQLRAQRQRRAPNFRAAADLVLTWADETPDQLATRIIDRCELAGAR